MDLFCIGEMVIDFIPGTEPGSYIRNAGGAPANVAIAAARNGLSAGFCGKMGNDDFGRFLIKTLQDNHVKVLCRELTGNAITTMAFVTLAENGERSFTFARKPGADMLLKKIDLPLNEIDTSSIIHTGSTSLSAKPIDETVMFVIKRGHKQGKIISFDVNYRDAIWNNDIQKAARRLFKILSYVDFLKISEEEISMIGGESSIFHVMQDYHITLIVEMSFYIRNGKKRKAGKIP